MYLGDFSIKNSLVDSNLVNVPVFIHSNVMYFSTTVKGNLKYKQGVWLAVLLFVDLIYK